MFYTLALSSHKSTRIPDQFYALLDPILVHTTILTTTSYNHYLRYECSTPTSQEFEMLCCLSVSQSVKNRCHPKNLNLFRYKKAYKPYTEAVPYRTNYCCPIMTQYTDSSPRNAQLSKLEQINCYFISIYYWPRTKACNLNTDYTYLQLQIKAQTRGKTVTGVAQI